jgi:caffeoyl-CoA O-methyltransferase
MKWITGTGTVLALVLLSQPGRAQPASRAAKEGTPMPKSSAEKRVLEVIDDVPGYLAVPREDGRLLRILAESMGAKHVVELGTSTGYSGLWLALALRATGGRLTTFEIDPERAATARKNFKRAGLDDIVTVVLGDAHVEVTKLEAPIDLVFIDADKEGYLDYLDKLLPLVRPGGLIIAHNMRSPPPDPRYVTAITTRSDLETVFVNNYEAGIGLTLKKR